MTYQLIKSTLISKIPKKFEINNIKLNILYNK